MIDSALLGMAGAATMAIGGAAVFVIRAAFQVGGYVQRAHDERKYVEQIPELVVAVDALREQVSELRGLRESEYVNGAMRASQGDIG